MARMIVLNDWKEVDRILSEGLSTNIKYDISLLAKYCKHTGFGPVRTKKRIIEVLVKSGLNPVQYDSLISWAINTAKRYKLREKGRSIVITWNEIAKIKDLPVDESKVLFLMLVVAKYEKFNPIRVGNKKETMGYFCWHKMEDVVKSAGIRKSKKEIDQMKYRLDGELGLISASLISEANWRILFADDNSSPYIEVTDIERIMDFYPYFCDKCGIKLDKKSKKHSFCLNCYKDKRREDVRNNVRRLRQDVIK